MHMIEPFFYWRDWYKAEFDEKSPFFEREYSEFEFTNRIYNNLIHPQWDYFESSTLLCKVLFADYDEKFAMIELLGEWNDLIDNDIMLLKQEVLDIFILSGIKNFIFIGENVLNFHGDTLDYYDELQEEIDDGIIVFINFQEHVLREMYDINLDTYFLSGGELDEFPWRKMSPQQNFNKIKSIYNSRLSI
jgi:hypothetical protein